MEMLSISSFGGCGKKESKLIVSFPIRQREANDPERKKIGLKMADFIWHDLATEAFSFEWKRISRNRQMFSLCFASWLVHWLLHSTPSVCLFLFMWPDVFLFFYCLQVWWYRLWPKPVPFWTRRRTSIGPSTRLASCVHTCTTRTAAVCFAVAIVPLQMTAPVKSKLFFATPATLHSDHVVSAANAMSWRSGICCTWPSLYSRWLRLS